MELVVLISNGPRRSRFHREHSLGRLEAISFILFIREVHIKVRLVSYSTAKEDLFQRIEAVIAAIQGGRFPKKLTVVIHTDEDGALHSWYPEVLKKLKTLHVRTLYICSSPNDFFINSSVLLASSSFRVLAQLTCPKTPYCLKPLASATIALGLSV